MKKPHVGLRRWNTTAQQHPQKSRQPIPSLNQIPGGELDRQTCLPQRRWYHLWGWTWGGGFSLDTILTKQCCSWEKSTIWGGGIREEKKSTWVYLEKLFIKEREKHSHCISKP